MNEVEMKRKIKKTSEITTTTTTQETEVGGLLQI